VALNLLAWENCQLLLGDTCARDVRRPDTFRGADATLAVGAAFLAVVSVARSNFGRDYPQPGVDAT
jgi:hypothetical protein